MKSKRTKRDTALTPAVKDAIRYDLTELAKALPTVESVTRASVMQWKADRLAAGMATSTIIKKLSGFGQYWAHLVAFGDAVDDEKDPFDVERLNIVRPVKDDDEQRQSFTVADAKRLLAELARVIRVSPA